MFGHLAEVNVSSIADIVPLLQEAIAHCCPDSTNAKCLDSQTIERAVYRLFRPPVSGAQVLCPDCGAPHAAPPGMTELIEFTRQHCGAAAKVDPPKEQ
jgi:hypothetical protein